MAVEIKMPQLSDTMHSGKILGWKKQVGDKIARGDILAEVETEKANLEIESFHSGTLLKILVPALSPAGVGDVIAILGAPGEQIEAGGATAALTPAAKIAPATVTAPAAITAPAIGPRPQLIPNFPSSASLALQSVSSQPATLWGSMASATETPAAETVASEITGSEQLTSSSAGLPHATPGPSSFAGGLALNVSGQGGRIKASPLAKKIAADHNVDLSLIRGSGPEGRIVRKDVISSPRSDAADLNAPGNTMTTRAVASAGGATREMSKMRKLIAARMQESVREAPHFYVTTKVNMGEAKKLQAALKARPEFAGISLNHFIVKASAYALAHEPRVNNAVRDGAIFEPDQINIGVITAVEDGLLIPVIKEANKLSLREIAIETRAAVERAKAGKPTSADLTGGTFSISNMGMFDVESFTAIINPGQGAVLAVSSTISEPIIVKGQIVVGETMKVTLSVDHRIIDGVMGATFLKHFKEALEMPALLVL